MGMAGKLKIEAGSLGSASRSRLVSKEDAQQFGRAAVPQSIRLPKPMEASQQEATRLPPPVIAVPSALDEDFRQRLLGLKNARIVEQTTHGYVDVGENTLVHLLDARDLQPGIQDRSLVTVLTDMAKRCEFPVLLIVGNLYGKPPVEISRSRSIAGFITHLELFTRIRAIQAPDRFHAAMILQLLAKQAQRGFHSLGLEDL